MNAFTLQSTILNEVERIESETVSLSLQTETFMSFARFLTEYCYDYYGEDENPLNELRTLNQLLIHLTQKQKKTAFIIRGYYPICHFIDRGRNLLCPHQDRTPGTDTRSQTSRDAFSLSLER